MIFPLYRKHSSGKNHYKISDYEHFIEIQCIGSKTLVHEVQAQTYLHGTRKPIPAST